MLSHSDEDTIRSIVQEEFLAARFVEAFEFLSAMLADDESLRIAVRVMARDYRQRMRAEQLTDRLAVVLEQAREG